MRRFRLRGSNESKCYHAAIQRVSADVYEACDGVPKTTDDAAVDDVPLFARLLLVIVVILLFAALSVCGLCLVIGALSKPVGDATEADEEWE
jgi:hypothetical protein